MSCKRRLSNNEIELGCELLLQQITEHHDLKSFVGIIGIARGGLIPAVYLSHASKIPKFRTITLSSYCDETNKQTSVIMKDIFFSKKKWLIIDELVDSGKTLEKVREQFPNSVFAVLYTKPKGKAMADFWAYESDQDTWLEFPWE